MNAAATPSESRRCPGDERLIAWLVGETPALAGPQGRVAARRADHDAIAAHVLGCDRCVAELRIVRDRLCLAAEIAAPVPVAVAARARAADAAPVARAAATEIARGWWPRLQAAFRAPMLVPVAALLALVVVGGNLDRGTAPTPEESTRDVPLRQKARVTAAQATLHADPVAGAAATAELGRGDAVVLVTERDGWYQVELADGRAGWMERSAFE
jgi:hypothetical protein